MPNIAAVLKDEIRRLARREIKAETGATKQAVAQYRGDIAKLKRTVQAQQKEIAFLKVQERKRVGQPQAAEAGALEGVRFSVRSVRATAAAGAVAGGFRQAPGVSPLTIYFWEIGKARPKKERLAALVAVRKLGKREAIKKLEMLQ